MLAEDHREHPPAAPEPVAGPASPAPASEPLSKEVVSADDLGEGLWARIRAAFIGFARGLRGQTIAVPPGEEGSIPVVEAEAARRKVERKLEKAQARIQELQDDLKARQDEVRERDEKLKELQREFNQAKGAVAKEQATITSELEETRQKSRSKDERLQELRTKLDARSGELTQANSEVEALRRQVQDAVGLTQRKLEEAQREIETLGKEKGRLAQLVEENEAQQAGWNQERDEREAALAQLRASTDPLREELGQLRQERDGLRAQLDTAEPELRRTRELADQAQKSGVFQEAAYQKQIADLRADLDEKDKQIEEIGSQLLKQMDEAGQIQDRLQAEVAHWKKESEDADRARESSKKKEAGGEAADSASAQRDLKRKEAQLETLQKEYERVQVRAKRMEDVLHEFYSSSVNPLTIAKVSVDLIPLDSLKPDDADTLNDLKQNISQVLEVIRALVKKMESLEIPIERPAQQPPPAAAAPAEEVPLAVPPKKPRKP